MLKKTLQYEKARYHRTTAKKHKILKNCGFCGKLFVAKDKHNKYCSKLCQRKEQHRRFIIKQRNSRRYFNGLKNLGTFYKKELNVIRYHGQLRIRGALNLY